MIALVSFPVGGVVPKSPSWTDSATRFARTLAEGRSRDAATEMLLPPSMDPGAVDLERDQIARAIDHSLAMLGRMSEIKIVDEQRSFYEFIIGGGPRPYWWREDHGTERDVLLGVRFGIVGDGLLRVTLVSVRDRLVVAAFGFGLDARRDDARERITALRNSIYDVFGLSSDHPLRSTELTPVQHLSEDGAK